MNRACRGGRWGRGDRGDSVESQGIAVVEFEVDLVVFDPDGVDQACGLLVAVVEALNHFADQLPGGADLVLEGQLLEHILHIGGGLELSDLAHLGEEFLVFRGLHGILVLQLRDHDLDEVFGLELHFLVSQLRGGLRTDRQCNHVGTFGQRIEGRLEIRRGKLGSRRRCA